MVYGKLSALLARQFGVSKESLTPQTNLLDDLGADSLDLVEFTTSIEQEFGLIIVDESIREMTTLGALSDFVGKLIKA